eukprot:6199281-Pleurochrysis_carterae.AAC.1
MDRLRVESGERRAAQNGSHRVGEEVRLAHQGQPMDEVSSVTRKATENLPDERGDHVPALPRVLILRPLERRGASHRAYDGGKQAGLNVCEGEGGPKSDGGGTASGGLADELVLEKLMVLCGRGVMLESSTQSGHAFKL